MLDDDRLTRRKLWGPGKTGVALFLASMAFLGGIIWAGFWIEVRPVQQREQAPSTGATANPEQSERADVLIGEPISLWSLLWRELRPTTRRQTITVGPDDDREPSTDETEPGT